MVSKKRVSEKDDESDAKRSLGWPGALLPFFRIPALTLTKTDLILMAGDLQTLAKNTKIMNF